LFVGTRTNKFYDSWAQLGFLEVINQGSRVLVQKLLIAWCFGAARGRRNSLLDMAGGGFLLGIWDETHHPRD